MENYIDFSIVEKNVEWYEIIMTCICFVVKGDVLLFLVQNIYVGSLRFNPVSFRSHDVYVCIHRERKEKRSWWVYVKKKIKQSETIQCLLQVRCEVNESINKKKKLFSKKNKKEESKEKKRNLLGLEKESWNKSWFQKAKPFVSPS